MRIYSEASAQVLTAPRTALVSFTSQPADQTNIFLKSEFYVSYIGADAEHATTVDCHQKEK